MPGLCRAAADACAACPALPRPALPALCGCPCRPALLPRLLPLCVESPPGCACAAAPASLACAVLCMPPDGRLMSCSFMWTLVAQRSHASSEARALAGCTALSTAHAGMKRCRSPGARSSGSPCSCSTSSAESCTTSWPAYQPASLPPCSSSSSSSPLLLPPTVSAAAALPAAVRLARRRLARCLLRSWRWRWRATKQPSARTSLSVEVPSSAGTGGPAMSWDVCLIPLLPPFPPGPAWLLLCASCLLAACICISMATAEHSSLPCLLPAKPESWQRLQCATLLQPAHACRGISAAARLKQHPQTVRRQLSFGTATTGVVRSTRSPFARLRDAAKPSPRSSL